MVRDYELAYIIKADLDETAIKASVDSVDALVVSHGGEVVRTALWGRRRLAYEIAKMRDGYYAISAIRLDPDKVTEMERSLRLHDSVFRHMIVVRDGDVEAANLRATANAAAAPLGEGGDGDDEGQPANEELVGATPLAHDDTDEAPTEGDDLNDEEDE